MKPESMDARQGPGGRRPVETRPFPGIPGVEERREELGGSPHRSIWTIGGSGPLVALVHGSPGAPESWMRTLARLSEARVRAVAITMLGGAELDREASVLEQGLQHLYHSVHHTEEFPELVLDAVERERSGWFERRLTAIQALVADIPIAEGEEPSEGDRS